MNNGNCLLREILERPEDDTARLVYADWLMEHGDRKRGEFIRDSEAVWLANYSYPNRMAFLPFVVEGCWLCTDADGGWLLFDAVTGDEVADRVEVRLGFIEAVSCTSQNWMAWADRLLSQHPIRTVRLTTELLIGDRWLYHGGVVYSKKGKRKRFQIEYPKYHLNRQLGLLKHDWPRVHFELSAAARTTVGTRTDGA